MSAFKRAVQTSRFCRLVLVGPSGSGKTFTALSLAGEKSALISLEGDSMALPFPVDTVVVGDVAGVVDALSLAAKAGYPAVVVDCLSTLWNGPKGVLGLVDQHGDRGWPLIRDQLGRLYKAIQAFPGHVLCTVRAEEIRLVVEREGTHRVLCQVGKPTMDKDFGSHFDVILELSGAVADCKKGPPSVYGKLWPQPGAELAALLLPQEAAPETPAHPLETGISIPSSGLNPTGQSEEAEMLEVVHGLREFAKEAARFGIGAELIRKVWSDNEGRLNAKGQLVGMPKTSWASARDDIEELIRKAKAEAETPWQPTVRL